MLFFWEDRKSVVLCHGACNMCDFIGIMRLFCLQLMRMLREPLTVVQVV